MNLVVEESNLPIFTYFRSRLTYGAVVEARAPLVPMSRTQIAAAKAGAIGGPSTTRDGNTAAAGAAGTHNNSNNNNPFSDAESDAEDGSAAAPEEPPPTYTDAMRHHLH